MIQNPEKKAKYGSQFRRQPHHAPEDRQQEPPHSLLRAREEVEGVCPVHPPQRRSASQSGRWAIRVLPPANKSVQTGPNQGQIDIYLTTSLSGVGTSSSSGSRPRISRCSLCECRCPAGTAGITCQPTATDLRTGAYSGGIKLPFSTWKSYGSKLCLHILLSRYNCSDIVAAYYGMCKYHTQPQFLVWLVGLFFSERLLVVAAVFL